MFLDGLFSRPVASQSSEDKNFGASRLRLATILGLRWVAVGGQLIAVLSVYFLFGFELPLIWCLGVIALSAILNVVLRLKNPSTLRLRAPYAIAMLTYDILQLSVLLYLTGGLQNPFAFLVLVPVTISAATQPLRSTVLLGAVAVMSATILAQYYLPLPWVEHGGLELPVVYRMGLWVGLVSSILFIAFYTWRIAQEAREMADALAAMELVLAREQQLTALDGLAAAAAHELGTPLSTISVVSKELAKEVEDNAALSDDFKLIRGQARRCQEILAMLTKRGRMTDDLFMRMSLLHMLEDVIEPHRSVSDVEITVSWSQQPGTSLDGLRQPIFERNPGILYALGNLIENAVDFADSEVLVEAEWGDEEIIVRISDDGPGFSQQILQGLGDPYITTRPSVQKEPGQEDRIGMGLGFFISNMFLRRSFATVTWGNKPLPDHGAIVTVTWQRRLVDQALKQASVAS